MTKELSIFIQQEIERLGISERELSRRAGLSTTAVHHIVNRPDSRPTFETCIALAKAINVSNKVLLQMAGYGDIVLSGEVDAAITALTIYLNGLPPKIREYALEGCWSVVRLVAEVAEGREISAE